MTDAREIIVGACFDRETAGLQAIAIMTRLTAAGFRIIGKDEVDQVTLDKAVDAATDAYANNDDWDYFNSAEVSITAAIRAIGRKA